MVSNAHLTRVSNCNLIAVRTVQISNHVDSSAADYMHLHLYSLQVPHTARSTPERVIRIILILILRGAVTSPALSATPSALTALY
jgi:hypothetical protein